MCIILGPVNRVAQTKLFVLPTNDKTRQMTFYSNAVDTPHENLMILPVPASGGPIELHTIVYKSLFQDLRASVSKIEAPRPSFLTRSLSASASLRPQETLEVLLHGSYAVSIAPKLEDLRRLDQTLFDVTEDLIQFFAKHYSREFSYICCVLKKGEEAYEPLCYSHPLHSSGKLFVPTLHSHNHNGKVETSNADWDHSIYSVGTEEKANLGYVSTYSNSVDWSRFPLEYQKLKVSSIRCAGIHGFRFNTDISFALY